MNRTLFLLLVLAFPAGASGQLIDAIVGATGRHRWEGSSSRRSSRAVRPVYDAQSPSYARQTAPAEDAGDGGFLVSEMAGPMSWQAAEELSRFYAERIRGMNRTSTSLYELLQQAEAERANMQRTGQQGGSFDEALAQSQAVLDRTKRVFTAYLELQDEAMKAAYVRPRLAELLGYLAEHELKGAVPSAEFKAQQHMLYVKGDQLARQVDRLKAEPITLPANFDQMGRYLKESIEVLDKSVRVDRIRGRLSTENLSRDAAAVGFERYFDYYADWRSVQLTRWREEKLKELFHTANLDIESIKSVPGGGVMSVSHSQPDASGSESASPVQSSIPSLAWQVWNSFHFWGFIKMCGCFLVGFIILAVFNR